MSCKRHPRQLVVPAKHTGKGDLPNPERLEQKHVHAVKLASTIGDIKNGLLQSDLPSRASKPRTGNECETATKRAMREHARRLRQPTVWRGTMTRELRWRVAQRRKRRIPRRFLAETCGTAAGPRRCSPRSEPKSTPRPSVRAGESSGEGPHVPPNIRELDEVPGTELQHHVPAEFRHAFQAPALDPQVPVGLGELQPRGHQHRPHHCLSA